MDGRKDSQVTGKSGEPDGPETPISAPSARADYSTFSDNDSDINRRVSQNDQGEKGALVDPSSTDTANPVPPKGSTLPPVTTQPGKSDNVKQTKKSDNKLVMLRHPEQQETEQWSFRLFGCFEDKQLCLSTFCLPCYTEARNAAYFYEEEDEVCVGYCFGLCGVGSLMRWRIRQHKHIEGHMLADVATHVLCPCCALIQENREIYGTEGSHLGEKWPILKKK